MKKIYLIAAVVVGMISVLCGCQPSLEDTVLELADPDAAVVYDYERQSGSFQINTNCSWKATCSENWIEITTTKGSAGDGRQVGFMLARNEGYQYREAIVTVTAGKARLDVVVRQAPKIVYYINENFDDKNLLVESSLPEGWFGDNNSALDVDGDGFGWRCWRDPATNATYAYSCSYHEDLGWNLSPDNYMTSPRFTIPGEGFKLRWDAKGSDPDFLGDKYQVHIASYISGEPLKLIKMICEEVTFSAETLTPHEFSLDEYVGTRICIAFRHYDSVGCSRVLITNVEVSNR